MPKLEAQWEFVKEADDLVKQIVAAKPEHFNKIDPDQIGCVMIVNKEPPKGQDWDAKISGITAPDLLFAKKTYVVQFYKSTWDKYDRRQRIAMLIRLLFRIPEEFDGSILKEDLKDSRKLVKAFGVDYMTNPKLPDLLEDKLAI